MKFSIHFFAILVLFSIATSCSKTLSVPYQRTGEVTPVAHERSLIKVQSSTKAANPDAAVSYAERQAIENILFKGIPNSNQEIALIESESLAWSKHKSILESLIINGGYKRFMTSSETAELTRANGLVFIKQNVQIDLSALRKYLVNEKVINSFGL